MCDGQSRILSPTLTCESAAMLIAACSSLKNRTLAPATSRTPGFPWSCVHALCPLSVNRRPGLGRAGGGRETLHRFPRARLALLAVLNPDDVALVAHHSAQLDAARVRDAAG